MTTKVPTGHRRARIIFLSALVGLGLVAVRVAQHDVADALAVIAIAGILVFAAMAEWPELDRMWHSRDTDVTSVDRLEKMMTDEAPPPTQDFF